MRSLLFLSLSLLLACKTRKEAVPPVLDSPVSGTPLIRLATQGCRGYCPVYTLDFYNNGSATYEGSRFVEKMGKVDFQLTPAEWSALQAEVKKVNLWQYPEYIESGVADAPYATLTVYEGSKSHPVSGSIDRPKPIMGLEMMLKDLAEAHGLEVKKGFNPDDPIHLLTAQVVVHLKPEINAGNWVDKFDGDIKLRLKRRVATENNWLVAYNPKQFSEKEIIDLLKTVDGVLDAVPSKEPLKRN